MRQDYAVARNVECRMFATVRFARYASAAIGSLLGGFVGELAGLTTLTVLTAIGATLSVLWLAPRSVWAGSTTN
jgi:hypothetical protein